MSAMGGRWIATIIVAGFTTNPSLLKKAGVSDYTAFGKDLVAAVPDRHISFEVFSGDIPEMVAQARVIAGAQDRQCRDHLGVHP